MVAFTIKHDLVFAAHFLTAVCGAPKDIAPSDYQIEFQPQHHADLIIYSKAKLIVYIIEFKIGADLQTKQNPWERGFYGPAGYGAKILRDPRWKTFKKRSYVVLQNTRLEQEDQVQRGLRCLSRSWRDCVPSQPPSGLFADLLDSLGELGVPSLKVWKGNHMKLGESVKSAVEMTNLLRGIADEFKLSGRRRWEVNQSPDDWWYGLECSTQATQFKKLAAVVKSKWSVFGWFGFQQNREGKSERAVWLYCGNRKQQELTRNWIAKRLSKASFKLLRPDHDHLHLATTAETAEQDHAWFMEIFNQLKD